LLSILFGFISAASWGGGDFVGGLASRRAGAYRATLYGEVFGLAVLLAAAPFIHEAGMTWADWGWSLAAGAIGATGLALLYRALAEGQMSIAAPVSALMAAVLPVIAGALTEGLPGPATLAGFGLALLAVWLVSQGEGASKAALIRMADLRLPLLSGVCFGIYFILMHQGSQQGVLWPMIAARCAGAASLLVITAGRGELRWPGRPLWPLIALNASGDIGGNAFYILAGQAGRLDVAAVLGSLYPGSTVILAWLFLHEKITRLQAAGILTALAAILLIAL
jgi:drug/metabolite transporter (DMT)-like permease